MAHLNRILQSILLWGLLIVTTASVAEPVEPPAQPSTQLPTQSFSLAFSQQVGQTIAVVEQLRKQYARHYLPPFTPYQGKKTGFMIRFMLYEVMVKIALLQQQSTLMTTPVDLSGLCGLLSSNESNPATLLEFMTLGHQTLLQQLHIKEPVALSTEEGKDEALTSTKVYDQLSRLSQLLNTLNIRVPLSYSYQISQAVLQQVRALSKREGLPLSPTKLLRAPHRKNRHLLILLQQSLYPLSKIEEFLPMSTFEMPPFTLKKATTTTLFDAIQKLFSEVSRVRLVLGFESLQGCPQLQPEKGGEDLSAALHEIRSQLRKLHTHYWSQS